MKILKNTTGNVTLSIVSALLMIGCTETQTKEAITTADYQDAAKHLSSNLNQYVYGSAERGRWTGDSIYTYQKKTKSGKEFITVNTNTSEKQAAFDHQKLAEALAGVLEVDVKPELLPFYGISHTSHNTIEFSIDGKTYSCNLDDYSISTVEASNNGKPNRNEYVAPNGKIAAYISDHNLWVRNLETGAKTQLTSDGKQDYGYATNNAGWIKNDRPVLKWSPDSDKIATFQQDARGVGEMYLTSTKVGHPDLEAWKYELPGDSIVFMLERVIIDIPTRKITRLKTNADYQRSTITDHVADWSGELLDAEWSKDGSKFAFVSSSRDHKIAELKIADAKTGAVTSVFKEKADTYFESGVDEVNWHVLFDSNEFIWYSERDNWGHLYLYDLQTGELKNQITKGDWQVRAVLKVDTEARKLYFTAGGKEEGNPYHDYLYSVNFDGSDLICLTPDKGTHRTQISPSWEYIVDTYSSTTNAPVTVLRNMKGEKILDLEVTDISELKANGWQEPIEFTTKARDGETDLYGIMYVPSSYKDSESYPVLNYIYPGPQSGSVGNYSFRAARSDFQAIAELGFVVVAVDAMGTPGRSKSFHDAYYGNMGDNGLPDNITTIKQLAEKYPAMDTTRVGIWGHSGGGYASTDAVLRYPDFYDVAVSSSGNHDNRNYEADWGEKWHGLLKTNPDGTTNYDSQANQLLVENLKGKLLLAHGTMDNNVPPSNTLLVVEALIKANKDFDLIMYPNKRHGYGDMTKYMMRKRWDYFVKHLKGVEPPKEFSLDEL
ncbi:S9 family peptidase [Zhouia amylolytica]|uniref:Putative dipeptidyl peptidase IV n=1 Tax=Zhouia amylolytica AD3 TaxID=1286632 RepID=W2UKE6_9FLAO|nr:DPP IV N-terminal domain-containing protein [Zhouia amylolytica]ETN94474.1 putative dipeptidyl peptidase IV [Zhouia amylolytica AD3]